MKSMDAHFDDKGNAKHYQDQRINMIHLLEQIWGTQALIMFCEMNAFKYRMRAGKKDNPIQELTKAKWYETYAKHLRSRPIPDQPGINVEFWDEDFNHFKKLLAE